jgi:hypothetical protein
MMAASNLGALDHATAWQRNQPFHVLICWRKLTTSFGIYIYNPITGEFSTLTVPDRIYQATFFQAALLRAKEITPRYVSITRDAYNQLSYADSEFGTQSFL